MKPVRQPSISFKMCLMWNFWVFENFKLWIWP